MLKFPYWTPKVSCLHCEENSLAVYQFSDCLVGVSVVPEGCIVGYMTIDQKPVTRILRVGSFEDICCELVILMEAFGPTELGYAGMPLLDRLNLTHDGP